MDVKADKTDEAKKAGINAVALKFKELIDSLRNPKDPMIPLLQNLLMVLISDVMLCYCLECFLSTRSVFVQLILYVSASVYDS